MRTNVDRVVAAVALFGTITLSPPEVTDYSIRCQPVAELTCAYFHTSACRMMYSEVHLFESLEEAQNYKDGLDDFGRSHGTGSTDTYCHAATKGLCSGNHLLVDLA